MTWLTGWTYQKQLYISSTNSITQSSYQMKITVNYGSGTDSAGNIYCGNNCNTDFSDIRFTDTDGTTTLPYWIESYIASSSAIVWINIPSIPTGNSAYIYFYYNNPSATSISNGTNTFLFFDDFDSYADGNLNGVGGWTGNSDYKVQSIVAYKGKAVQSVNGVAAGITHSLPSRSIGAISIYMDLGSYETMWFQLNNGTNRVFAPSLFANPAHIMYDSNGAGAWTDFSPSISRNYNQWYKIDIAFNTITHKYIYVKVDETIIGTNLNSGTGSSIDNISLNRGGTAASCAWDIITFRNYASPEPTWGTIVTGSLSISSTPPEAEIYLNGVDQSITTTSPGTIISNLSPDTYNILLRLTGYADWTGTATVSSGTTTSVSATISHTQWLTNWNRRKQLDINGTTAGPQPSYQMKLTVNYSGSDSAGNVSCGGNCNTDFSDIRFTDSTGSTLLNYWVESYTSGSIATVWIQIPYILTGSNSVYIYIYYNNPSATSSSNGTNTFIFFDDFSSGNYNKWTVEQGTWTVVSNIKLAENGFSAGYEKIYTKISTQGNILYQYIFTDPPNGGRGQEWRQVVLLNDASIATGNGYSVISYWDTAGWADSYNWMSTIRVTAGVLTGLNAPATQPYTRDSNPHTLGISITNNTITAYFDGVAKVSSTDSTYTSFTRVYIYSYSANNIADGVYQYVIVREYVNPEPTWSSTISTEQLPVTLNISSTPTGAEIWLRSPAGTGLYADQGVQTPTTGTITLYVAPVAYDLKLTHGGYLDYILSNQIPTAGNTYNIPVTMSIIPGSLSISSTPTGAEIYIDGTDQQATTSSSGTTISNLSPGTYNITLTLTGYQNWTGTATVITNLTTPVPATFAGSAYITSTPSGAEIYLAISPGTPVDQTTTTPRTIINLTTASSGATTIWNYILKLSGYADTSGSFTATAGSTISIPVTFPGSLYITSIPTGASIYIDDVLQT